jgi:transposase
VKKLENEMHNHGRVLHPKEKKQKRKIGPGANSLDTFDSFVLLVLYLIEDTRTLPSYAENLFLLTGAQVSESTISRFFNHAFPIKGGLRKPNLVPYDKFRPENLLRARDYVRIISKVDPHRLKFGDEKHLKGAEIYCRRTRRNVLTGEVPPCYTAPDFRNTYTILGLCGIDRSTLPLFYQIHDGTNDAESFSRAIEAAVAAGFLKGGDVLVLDNASIHGKGDNTYLEDWLWKSFGIFVVFLPTRTPEWNPTELVWRMLVQRLKYYPIRSVRKFTSDAAAHAADDILSKITHRDIAGMYAKCELL